MVGGPFSTSLCLPSIPLPLWRRVLYLMSQSKRPKALDCPLFLPSPSPVCHMATPTSCTL